MNLRLPAWALRLVSAALFLAVAGGTVAPTAASQVATAPAGLPQRLSPADFWRLISDISEPGGYFRITDNYTSNEREIGRLFTLIRERGTSGGVYLGVGPEQNFTYIAAIRPAMAFIVDIRRQAVMQHLMYKAIFEMSADRADFISLLFSKPRPPGLDASGPAQRIWEAFWNVTSSDSVTWSRNLTRIVDRLTKTHGFVFTEEESAQLRDVYDAFYRFGPLISTRGAPGRGFGGNSITFAELTGFSADSTAQSFLATADHYAYVRSLHEKNLIVPVSGDFGGPKALRAIGAYLRERGGTVSAFYVSNVEQYLFQDGKQSAFYENVATLPVNEASIFIRPYSMRRATTTEPLCPIGAFLDSVQKGVITSNADALACPR